MKIAVTSLGESMESPVDQRFGRARFFIIVDIDTEAWSIADNKHNLEVAEGAGIQAAQHLINQGVQALITGHCGPNAFSTLSTASIKVYPDAEGSVQDALQAYRKGLLKRSAEADVEAGYGTI